MKDMGFITCSTVQAVPLVVGTDTIYIHSDIEAITKDSNGDLIDNLWKCHEIQYEKDEYIQLITNENVILKKQLADIQFALHGISINSQEKGD